MPRFAADVTRTSSRTKEFVVEAGSQKKARELLLEAAANHDFSREREDYATYSVGPLMVLQPRE